MLCRYPQKFPKFLLLGTLSISDVTNVFAQDRCEPQGVLNEVEQLARSIPGPNPELTVAQVAEIIGGSDEQSFQAHWVNIGEYPSKVEQALKLLKTQVGVGSNQEAKKYFTAAARVGGHAYSEIPYLKSLLSQNKFSYWALLTLEESSKRYGPSDKAQFFEDCLKELEANPILLGKVSSPNLQGLKDARERMKSFIASYAEQEKSAEREQRLTRESDDRSDQERKIIKAVEILETDAPDSAQLNAVLSKMREDKSFAEAVSHKIFDRNVYYRSDTWSSALFALEHLGGLATPIIPKLIGWMKWTTIPDWRGQIYGNAVLVSRVIEQSSTLNAEEKAQALGELALALEENPKYQEFRRTGRITVESGDAVLQFKDHQQKHRYLAALETYNLQLGSTLNEHLRIIEGDGVSKVPPEGLIAYMQAVNHWGRVSRDEFDQLQLKVITALAEYSADRTEVDAPQRRLQAETYLAEILSATKRYPRGEPFYSDGLRMEAARGLSSVGGVKGIPALLNEAQRRKTTKFVRGYIWNSWVNQYDEGMAEILDSITQLAKQNQRWRSRPQKFPAELFPTLKTQDLDASILKNIVEDTEHASESLRFKAKEALQALGQGI